MCALIRKVNLHVVLLLTASFVVFLIKCMIVYPIQYVGHADASGYAEMADSLIHGRGFEVDYISWYFVKYPEIVRPEDHWPPLYSIAIAPFFLILGKTAFAAKLPSLIISCFFLPLVIYSLTKELSGSRFPGLMAGFGVLLYPAIFRDSLYCLSDVLYTFVICAGVLFAAKALDDEKFFYPMGIFIGLAYYAKGSGLVPIPGYILFHVIARRSIKKVFTNRKFLLSLLIAFLILLPWFIRNFVHFGDPLFSTQRFSAGYIGYESWETGTYELYWGEKPPPSYFDKFRGTLLFGVKSEFQNDLDTGTISEDLRREFKSNNISLSDEAAVSIKKAGNRWVINDKNQTYNIRKEDNKLSIYRWGISHAARMTKEYLKRYFWWVFMDIDSRWGKFGQDAFLTYFTNIPAILGMFLLWGNKKRHVIWITSGLLILFMSAGWEPIYRLALPMIPLMMALGWATYFVVLRIMLKLLGMVRNYGSTFGWALKNLPLPPFTKGGEPGFTPPLKKGTTPYSPFVKGVGGIFTCLIPLKNEPAQLLSKKLHTLRSRLSLDMVAGIMACCLIMPVVVLSTESVQRAYKESGYPYHEDDQEWMDMGRWLKENAPSDTITMTRNPWELHFYSEQLAIQIPRTSLEKTMEVMRFYKPTYIIPQLDIRPSLTPLVAGAAPGLELMYDNGKLKLYKINYDILPNPGR